MVLTRSLLVLLSMSDIETGEPLLVALVEHVQLFQVKWLSQKTWHTEHTHRNPDTMYLVHNTYTKCIKLFPAVHKHATCVEVSLPDKLTSHFVNIHGPFTIQTRQELDGWISRIPSIGILMGGFNDTIWAPGKGH